MNEAIRNILIIASIQASYDFLGWFTILKEAGKGLAKWIFSIIKETLDFPVTIYLLINFDVPAVVIIAFYVAKWFGLCDMIYILIWYAVKRQAYISKYYYWFFFTPLGNYYTLKMFFSKDRKKIYAERKQIKELGEDNYWKGCITYKQFRIQLAIGLIISYLIILILWIC